MHTLEQLRSGELAGSRRLKLACGLSAFPREIFDLAETLEILDLSGNALSSLPDDLPRLHKLRILFCSDNRFTELPAVLGQCPQLSMIGLKANQIRTVPVAALTAGLRWLILTDNQLTELPAEIGHCQQLQKLMLAGNRLSGLPPEMAACTRLELLRIAANQFATLPDWLLSLPRLCWLAYAGNPFCENAELASLARTSIAPIAWDSLQLAHQLGEGASGVIHQADWLCDENPLTVAVKIFKGTLTSDGLPLKEMTACMAAGTHPNLIPLLGKVDQHPAGAHGLVMSLIDASFCNLAGPPSFDSCTRDVYPADKRFDLAAVLRIAHGIASAAEHLHAQGIMHGDLYAHNILHCDEGNALLGDFGAASFFVPEDRATAETLQRIEVRAFGCLLEELLQCCNAVPQGHFLRREASPPAGRGAVDAEKTLKTLVDLQAACAQETISARPLFAEIRQMLSGLIRR